MKKQTKAAFAAKPRSATRKAAKPKRSQKAFFETGFRLRQAEKEALRAQGLHVYSRRDNGKENTIEPNVGVDFMGTLVTNFKIPFKKKGPDANVIWQGDTYLKSVGAKEVRMVSALHGKNKKGVKR